MSNYKIVVDSCCEIPEEINKELFIERVPLTLEVGDATIIDDDTFNQAQFLKMVDECPTCPKSACPSPERYMEAYDADVERVYVITLTSKLSGSYNSAVLGKHLLEESGKKVPKIHVFDSLSASAGETQLVMKIKELEEQGRTFEEVVEIVELFKNEMKTYFVLDNLDTLRKNGRLTGLKAVVVSTMNIKPIMYALDGTIAQKSQAIGTKKALRKMADILIEEGKALHEKVLIISHCNCLERAQLMKERLLEKIQFKAVYILDMMGVSSMYANDGGIIVTV
ncbi:MAG: DegV family protein [Lachnospiraceae bacterium]|nr:DegV family protein [Lachnospiraceae bacterium]